MRLGFSVAILILTSESALAGYVSLARPVSGTGACTPVKGAIGRVVNADSYDLPSDQVFVRWETGLENCSGVKITAMAKKDLKEIAQPKAPSEAQVPVRVVKEEPPSAQVGEACDTSISTAKRSLSERTLLGKIDFASLTGQKTQAQLEEWLECNPTTHQQNYLKYRPFIERAAEAFRVDASILKCLLRQEGAWDPNNLSCTCAMGLGQQLESNAKYIQSLIGDSQGRLQRGETGATDYQRDWDNYSRAVKLKSQPGCSGNFLVDGNTGSPVAKTCGGKTKMCPRFSTDDRKCGAASISAAATFINVISKQLNISSTVDSSRLAPFEIQEKQISALAAYMVGNGTAMEAVKGIKDPKEWVLAIFAKTPRHLMRDMKIHLRALRVCLKHDEWGTPDEGGVNKCVQPVQMASSQ